jgi:hypothetical protein
MSSRVNDPIPTDAGLPVGYRTSIHGLYPPTPSPGTTPTANTGHHRMASLLLQSVLERRRALEERKRIREEGKRKNKPS